MVRRLIVGLALATGLALPCAAGSASGTPAEGPSAPADESAPFKIYPGPAIYLSGSINGHPVEMLLDSGASNTTIDRKFADRIGLKPTGTIPVHGLNGTVRGGTVSGVTISIGKFVLADQNVTITDDSALAAAMGRPFDVVLGRNVFDAAVIDVDFPSRRIAFRAPSTYRPPQGAIGVKLTGTSDGLVQVPVSIEGRKPVDGEFDLGQEMALSISHSYSQKEKLLESHRISTMLIGGTGGMSVWNVMRVGSLSIGGVEFHDLPAYISPGGGVIPKKGAIVGLDVWSRFHLAVDFRHAKLWLVPEPNATTAPFAHDRVGLAMVREGDHVRIMNVAVNSPAAASGWKTGDVIVAINGRRTDAAFFDEGDNLDWLNGPPGTKVGFTMADGTVRTLVLADYF